jgi:dolichol-phosphate mannosyltransferase
MPEISVIVPTYNEAESLPELARRLFAALDGASLSSELVVVDDSSPDGTGDIADQLARQHPMQVLHRPPKSGLASAVWDGMARARGDILVVMDADLSHPPEVVPALVQAVSAGGADLAVGSRYVPGGGVINWPWLRRFASWFACQLARPFVPMRDATSGFFALKRAVVEGVALDPIGFKIGLEVMAKGRYRAFREVPYTFTDRRFGQSKFGTREVQHYLRQLGRLLRRGRSGAKRIRV